MPVMVSEQLRDAASAAGRIGQTCLMDEGRAAVRQMGGDGEPLPLPGDVERGEARAVLVVTPGELIA